MKSLNVYLLSLMMLVLGGCAVMTVQVDVYKGPLANHEEIQMEQTISLAIGAKPLLIHLRDDIIISASNSINTLSQLYENPCYEPGYIEYVNKATCTITPMACKCLFNNSLARRVNAVLSLYEDRVPDKYRDIVQVAQNLLNWAEKYYEDPDSIQYNKKAVIEIDKLVRKYNQSEYVTDKFKIEEVEQFIEKSPYINRNKNVNELPIVRWNNLLDENVPKVKQTVNEFVISVSKTGLEEGRLDDGIETLIDHYLNAVKDNYGNEDAANDERQVLLNALARFAEKILTLANFEPFFINEDIKKDAKKMVSEYVQVLQAVGNSILIQVDELRHRGEQEKYLVRQATDEIIAAQSHQILDSTPNARNAKDVLDDAITSLRYELIKAKSVVKNTSEIQGLEAAIKETETIRNDMIYMRPSSAYLRSSFPSTSLQGDPGLSWSNMLQQHMYRQLPFFAELTGGFGNKRHEREIKAEIDKQYWQNINTVRVAGGGLTNYVIVKDDVGNWYVKGYSSDPEDIINSATTVATFGLGQKYHSLLAPNAPTGGSVKDKQVIAARHEYQTTTADQFADVKKALSGLIDDVSATYRTINNATLTQNLDNKSVNLKSEVQAIKVNSSLSDEKKSIEQSDKIIEMLQMALDYRKDMIRGLNLHVLQVQKQENPESSQVKTINIVIETIETEVNNFIEEWINKRLQTIDKFDNKLEGIAAVPSSDSSSN